MTIHVYPDPQTAALPVAPGATTVTLISQITGASVPAGAYNKMMFIRVAMFGGTAAPTLLIKAGTEPPCRSPRPPPRCTAARA